MCGQTRYCLRGGASDPQFSFALSFCCEFSGGLSHVQGNQPACNTRGVAAAEPTLHARKLFSQAGPETYPTCKKRIVFRDPQSLKILPTRSPLQQSCSFSILPPLQTCREAMSHESSNALGFADDASRRCCKLL